MDQTDFLLYGGIVVVASLIVSLGYRLYKRRGEGKPESEAMKKINDFFATQDQNHNY